MNKYIVVALFAQIVLFSSAPMASEDAVVADPEHYSVEFENDRVRIIRIKYGPGEKSVMHTHGANVSVMLTSGSVRFHFPDGTSTDVPGKTGQATWSEAEEHLPENIGDGPVEVVLVELKD